MGKRPLVSQLAKPVVIVGGKQQQRPRDLALASILTENEYASAVIAVVNRVEEDSEGNQNMQGLSSALRRLLLSRYDPPLPLYWTLVALEKSLWLDRTSKDPLEFGTNILNFAGRALRSLKSLSAINASGQTALSSVAPIVGLLYDVASLLSSIVGSLDENQQTGNTGGNGKRVKRLLRKLKELIQDLLSFTSLCHCKDLKNCERSFSLPLAPEVPLENFPDFLYPRLPLASKKANSLSRDSSNSAVFADIVSGEVVILQLVVETLDRRILLKKQNIDFIVGQDEFVQRLKNLSVHSVWDASSPSPSEMLLDLLCEKRLPVLDLLASKEEILLRGVLFEVVLIDAPLFSLFGEAGGEPNSSLSGLDHTSVVFMKKLSIARRAITFFRSQQERRRLASLLIQIRAWHFPPRLSKWLKSQKKQRLPVIALQDQQALINWLVNTAEKSVFTAILEKSVATWSTGLTSVGTAKHVEVVEAENGEARSDREGEDLFFVDTAGETELAAIDPPSADLDFTVAAQAMKGESDKMKKKNKKQSKVLFHRLERSSAGMKRSRIEVDDVHITSSSGRDSDSEDSEEYRSKSAKKKLKKSEHKAADLRASSEEGEDDDNDGALASAQLSREENSSVVESGYSSNQEQAEHDPAQRTEEHSIGVVSEELKDGVRWSNDGVGAEGLLSHTDRETGVTSLSASEIDVRNSSTTSQVAPVLPIEGKSAKKKKKLKDPADPDMEVPADLGPPRSTEELTGGVRSNELTGGVVAQELLSQPAKETVISSVSVDPVDIRKSSTMSQVETVLLSVGKSAKKTKTRSEDRGDPDMEAPAELNPLQRTEELAAGLGTEELTGGVGTEELLSQPNEEVLITSVSANEVDSRDSLTVSQVDSVSLSVEKSAKKKTKKSKDPGDPDTEALGELNLPRRAEKLGGLGTEKLIGVVGTAEHAGGAGTEELTGGVGTEELLSQPNKERVITSVSAKEVDSRDFLTTSQVDLVPLSVRKSAKKKMKKLKDPGDPDMEALGELNLPQRAEKPGGVGTEKLIGGVGTEELAGGAGTEEVTGGVGTEELAGGAGTEEVTGGVGTEELLSPPNKEMVITSVSANEVDSRDFLTTSQVDLVPLSVRKSAKKKMKKLKDPGDPDMETLGELNLPQRAGKLGGVGTEKLIGGVGTEEVTGGVGTEELLSQPNKEMVITAVSANEVDSRDSLTTSQVDLVPLSVRKSARKKMKKSKDPGDPNMETHGELNPPQRTEKLSGGVGTEELKTRADVQGEEMEDLAQKATTASCEELKTRRSSSTLSIPTPQNEGSDGRGVFEDVTGAVQSPSLRNIQEEIPVVKSTRKKRIKEHPGEGDEGYQHQIFDMIKEELVTASAKFSSADLIDALQVEESLPVNQQLSSKTKTSRSKRARLGEEANNAGTTTRQSALRISALNLDKTRSANETTQDGNVSQDDVATTEEEALLSASLTKEILGNPQNEEGQPHDESGQNISAPVAIQVNPPNDSLVSPAEDGPQNTARPLVKHTKSPIKNVVEKMEVVPQNTPLKNKDGTGTPRSRRKRSKSQTDVGLPVVAEDRVQPKEELCEEAPIASQAQMLERGEGQEEREVRTPDAVVQVSDVEIGTSARPSSRKRKGKAEIFQLSGGSDTTDEMLYQRRTRSGRALGTPPPTPTRKANMRRKLVLEPLEEEK